MDTLSFGLGIAAVVVTAIAVVAVLALVKSIKNQHQLERLWQSYVDSNAIHTRSISDIKNELDKRMDSRSVYELKNELDRRIDSEVHSIHSKMDSRLDKLENKLTK